MNLFDARTPIYILLTIFRVQWLINLKVIQRERGERERKRR